ncbi:MAG: aromatic acid exporter family protein [Bacillota bacterium]
MTWLVRVRARILKTGIAIALALTFASWLGLKPGTLAAVAAVVAMQPSINKSYKTTKMQLVANFFGAVIGVVFALYIGYHPVVVGIASIMVMTVAVRLGFADAVTMAAITVIAIMDSPDADLLKFALNRLALVTMGLATAFAVNVVIMPPDYRSRLLEEIDHTRKKLERLMEAVHAEIASSDLGAKSLIKQMADDIRSEINKCRELYSLATENSLPLLLPGKQLEDTNRWINAMYSNLERLLEVHHSGVLIAAEDQMPEQKQDLAELGRLALEVHRQVFNHLIFGHDLNSNLLSEYNKKQLQIKATIMQVYRTKDMFEYHNILMEYNRLVRKTCKLTTVLALELDNSSVTGSLHQEPASH